MWTKEARIQPTASMSSLELVPHRTPSVRWFGLVKQGARRRHVKRATRMATQLKAFIAKVALTRPLWFRPKHNC